MTNKTMFIFLFIVLVITLAFVAYALYEPPITCGTIRYKKFVPQHEESQSDLIIIGEVMIPTTNVVTVPDQYLITIEGERDGHITYRDVEVTKKTYEKYKIGDFFRVR